MNRAHLLTYGSLPSSRAEPEAKVIERLRQSAEATPEAERPRACKEAATLIKSSGSAAVRNAAALALADMRCSGAAATLNVVAARADVALTAGTLLYALSELKGPVAISTALNIVRHGSYEARAELMIAIENGGVVPFSPSEAEEARRELTQLVESGDVDTAEAAELALGLLPL